MMTITFILISVWAVITTAIVTRMKKNLRMLTYGQKLFVGCAANAKTASDFLLDLKRGNPDSIAMEPTRELPETIDCHTCGCMVKKENAVKGESRIEKIEIGNWPPMFPKHLIPTEERIVNDWYCKRCAPKHEPLTCTTTTTAMAGSVGSTPTTTAPVQSADAETRVQETLGLGKDDISVLRDWVLSLMKKREKKAANR